MSPAGKRSAKLRLDPALPLAEGLARAMQDVLAHAAGWAARAGQQPAIAVHELRKSIRRARALLALSRPLLEERKAEALGDALRKVQAAASEPRDTDVLLQQLRAHPGLRARGAPRRALARLTTDLRRQQRQTRAGLPPMLVRCDRSLPALGRRYARALPRHVARGELQRALRESHRRVRHLQRRSRHHGHDDERFHDWRKAVKTLSYQLELVASSGRGWARRASRRVGDLAQAQGEVTDLIMLRRRLTAQLTAADDADSARVLDDLQALIDERRREVFRQGKRTLALPPRRFIGSLA